MSERKVINKYYPPDFDPSKIPRARRPKDNQFTVRMMLPMSVRCTTCGEYMGKAKKFNAKKETVRGEEYLTLKIFRFYMKCTACAAEFTIKTDPQNSDYVVEAGAVRNFEPWKENAKIVDEAKKQREEEEEGDVMKQLENKSMDSKVELDIMEGLDDIRAINARNAKLSTEEVLEGLHKQYQDADNTLDPEDAEILANTVFKNSKNYVRRIEADVSEEPQAKKLKEDTPPALPAPKEKISFIPIVKKTGFLKHKLAANDEETPKVALKSKPIAVIQSKVVAKPKEQPSLSLVDY